MVGEVGGGFRANGLRKLHPPSRTVTTRVVEGDLWQRTETRPLMTCCDALEAEKVMSPGETTDPQGARANRRIIPPARGAGSPHSQMPLRTEDGLHPPHQPNLFESVEMFSLTPNLDR